MSKVDVGEIDFNARYSYASFSMSHGIKLNLTTEQLVEFKEGVLHSIEQAFDTTLRAISGNHDNLEEENEHYLFFCESLRDFSKGRYSGNTAIEKILVYSRLVKNLKGNNGSIVRGDRASYLELQTFLEYLHGKLSEKRYDDWMKEGHGPLDSLIK